MRATQMLFFVRHLGKGAEVFQMQGGTGRRPDGLADEGCASVAEGCGFCAGTEVEVVSNQDRHGAPLVTVLCTGCGMLRNDPVPTEAELTQFYRSAYRESYKGAAVPRRRQVWRNLRRLDGHFRAFRDVYAKGGAWLDLGSGSGEFTFLANRLGAQVTAVEPHLGYAAYCGEQLGLKIEGKRLEDCDFDGPRFDLIRLSHVLEHMRDPVASLRRLAGWLRPGGVIYVEVPDIEQDAQNKLRGRMFHFGHIHNFNPVLLRHAAGLAGLVELPATAARSAGRCGAFFTVGTGGVLDAAALAANAQRMRAVMAAHNGRRLPQPPEGTAVGRFFARLGARLGEGLAAATAGPHRAMAEATAQRLQRDFSRS